MHKRGILIVLLILMLPSSFAEQTSSAGTPANQKIALPSMKDIILGQQDQSPFDVANRVMSFGTGGSFDPATMNRKDMGGSGVSDVQYQQLQKFRKDLAASGKQARADDFSIAMLRTLFGRMAATDNSTSILDGAYQSNMVGTLFRWLNYGILGVVGLLVTYATSLSMIEGSRRGTFLSPQQKTAMVFARLTTGSAMLTPLSSGYSVIQLLVMYVILQGIDLANNIWSVVMDTYARQIQWVLPSDATSSPIAAKTINPMSADQVLAARQITYNIFMSEVCREQSIQMLKDGFNKMSYDEENIKKLGQPSFKQLALQDLNDLFSQQSGQNPEIIQWYRFGHSPKFCPTSTSIDCGSVTFKRPDADQAAWSGFKADVSMQMIAMARGQIALYQPQIQRLARRAFAKAHQIIKMQDASAQYQDINQYSKDTPQGKKNRFDGYQEKLKNDTMFSCQAMGSDASAFQEHINNCPLNAQLTLIAASMAKAIYNASNNIQLTYSDPRNENKFKALSIGGWALIGSLYYQLIEPPSDNLGTAEQPKIENLFQASPPAIKPSEYLRVPTTVDEQVKWPVTSAFLTYLAIEKRVMGENGQDVQAIRGQGRAFATDFIGKMKWDTLIKIGKIGADASLPMGQVATSNLKTTALFDDHFKKIINHDLKNKKFIASMLQSLITGPQTHNNVATPSANDAQGYESQIKQHAEIMENKMDNQRKRSDAFAEAFQCAGIGFMDFWSNKTQCTVPIVKSIKDKPMLRVPLSILAILSNPIPGMGIPWNSNGISGSIYSGNIMQLTFQTDSMSRLFDGYIADDISIFLYQVTSSWAAIFANHIDDFAWISKTSGTRKAPLDFTGDASKTSANYTFNPVVMIQRYGMLLMYSSINFYRALTLDVVFAMMRSGWKYTFRAAMLKLIYAPTSFIGKFLLSLSANSWFIVWIPIIFPFGFFLFPLGIVGYWWWMSPLGAVLKTFAQFVHGIIQVQTMFYEYENAKRNQYIPLAMGAAAPILAMGTIFAIYVPMLPYLIYTVTVFGWLICVVESMVAAPIIALGITHPRGHDFLGRAEQGVILMMSIFIRPPAIVIGFIFGTILAYASFWLYLKIFSTFMLDMLTSPTTVGTYLINTFALLVMGYGVVSVINQSFSLIYRLPNYLVMWLGGHPDRGLEEEILGQIKQSADSGANTLGSAGSQQAGQGQSYQGSVRTEYGMGQDAGEELIGKVLKKGS